MGIDGASFKDKLGTATAVGSARQQLEPFDKKEQ